jgi:hypothetical protein
MKDLGVADVILNIKLLRDDDGGITLLQSHYVEKIVSRLCIWLAYVFGQRYET